MQRLARALAIAAISIAGVDSRAQETGSAGGERFDIMEYVVLGATALPAPTVERAVYPYLGPSRNLADVQSARASLEQAYRDAGFGAVFVDIPEQDVDDGVVRLSVTEGRLDRVRVTGARYYSQKKLLAQLPAAQSGEVLHLPTLQEQLRNSNSETPDRITTPVLKAGRSAGLVDLELKVTDEAPFHGAIDLNNRYSEDTTELRLNASLSYTNLFQRGQAFGLQYQMSPEDPDEVEVFAATYGIPWGSEGNSILLSAITSNTDVAAFGTLGVLGKGDIYGLKGLWRLPGEWSGTIVAGVDYKDVEETVRLPGEDDDLTPTDVDRPIDYLLWSVIQNAYVRRPKFAFTYTLGANFGMRGLSNDDDEFDLKRFGAPPNFFYVRGATRLDYTMAHGFSLGMRMSGQYSPTPLISNEQFAIGGMDTVRGYPEAALFGDYGIAGTLEASTPRIPTRLPISVLFTVFADAGVVRLDDPLPGQVASADLSSWGAGLVFEGFDGLAGYLYWAYPLVGSGFVDSGDDRYHFSFGYAF
jgi:hemolysin activation/secretion protein